jgi:hypothetical protein
MFVPDKTLTTVSKFFSRSAMTETSSNEPSVTSRPAALSCESLVSRSGFTVLLELLTSAVVLIPADTSCSVIIEPRYPDAPVQ